MAKRDTSKKKTTSKLSPQKQRAAAAKTARRGDTADAVAVFLELADGGDASAAASLAELLAFQGRWADMIPHAGRLLAHPDAVYASNVADDMLRLLGRAGRETGDWKQIEQQAEQASAAAKARVYEPHHEYQRERHLRLFTNLCDYAKRKGKPPHELLYIFGVSDDLAKLGPDEKRQLYEKAVANPPPYLKKKPPAEMAQHQFSLAVSYGQDDAALLIHEKFGPRMALRWSNAVHIARLLIGRQQPDKAWSVLAADLASWAPVDAAQVAPVELLIDEKLASIMTAKRCAEALATQRG